MAPPARFTYPLGIVLLAAYAQADYGFGRTVTVSFYVVVAQVIPLLLLALFVEFTAAPPGNIKPLGRELAERGADMSRLENVARKIRSDFAGVIGVAATGEAASLYAVAAGGDLHLPLRRLRAQPPDDRLHPRRGLPRPVQAVGVASSPSLRPDPPGRGGERPKKPRLSGAFVGAGGGTRPPDTRTR